MAGMRPLFLDDTRPLAGQVAAYLLKGCETKPPDLGDTLVIVPTTGAARAIRRSLARLAGGVLTPRFALPLEALLPEACQTATPLERTAAWIQALQKNSRMDWAALVPSAVRLEQPEDWIGVVTRLIHVCDALAEGGWTPASPEISAAAEHDTMRWEQFAGLHAAALDLLRQAGRPDPNEIRLASADHPSLPPHLRRVVVALVPDLPPVVARFLENAAAQGIAVQILAWSNGDDSAAFDAWGRPDSAWWTTHPVHIPGETLVVAEDSAGEASNLAGFAAEHGADGYAFFSAAAEMNTALEAEVARREGVPYLPGGRPLRQSEPATLLTVWEDFLATRRLAVLRPLWQLPVFLRLLCRESRLHPASVAACGERLLAVKLCDTLDDAIERLPSLDREKESDLHEFTLALQNLSASARQPREILGQFYDTEEEAEAATAEELGALVEALDDSAGSPLLAGFSPDWQETLRRAQLAERTIYFPAPAGAVEIQGWLEAPWTSAPVICVAGCREGALPAGGGEDAFLPDSLRRTLGLPTRDSLLARDAYLLSCLLHHYGSHKIRLGFSRFRPGGEPNRPSRLLFGCADSDLTARVEKLFQPSPRLRVPPVSTAWKLHLAAPSPVESIRVTGFKHYLECPLRFYLSQVLRWQPFDASAREINPADFGTLMHRVLENFHKKGLSGSDDQYVIATFLERELNTLAAATFGRHPLPAVRVQIESMRARLRQFAVLQAAERQAGWVITEAEFAVRKDGGFRLGPLALAGTMDRVEVHPEHGLRILDYKTFGRAKTPEETHFGPAREIPNLPQADVERPGKKSRFVEKTWSDLQLPLYRKLARELWPEDAARGLTAGYILLPGDPDDTGIALLDIDDDTQQSAETCALAVAALIACGVFWPPAITVDHDNFASWFGGEDPAGFFDDATIASLEGRP